MKLNIAVILICISQISCMTKHEEYELMLEALLSGSVSFIQPAELQQLDSSYILLDTRTPEEYTVSHIRDARFINYEEFEPSMVADLPRDTTVVLYCAVGYRSEKIGEKMKEMGFKDVRNLYGGIFAWKNQGMEVINPRGTRTDSVHAYDQSWSRWLWNGTKVYD